MRSDFSLNNPGTTMLCARLHRQQWHCGFLPPTPFRVIISATTDNRKFGNDFPLSFSHFLKYGGTQKMRRDSSHTRISHTKIAKNVIWLVAPLRQSHIWKTNAAVAQLGEASQIKPNWHPVTTGLSRPSKLRMPLGCPPKDPTRETSDMGCGRATKRRRNPSLC